MDTEDDIDIHSKNEDAQDVSKWQSNKGETSILADTQMKCKIHNKIFEAIVPQENRLMWADWVKASNKNTQKLHINDLNLLILSNLSENSEDVERFKTMLLIKKYIQDLLRKFFKTMHVMLYEIESSKKKQFEYIIKSLFGAIVNPKDTLEMFEKLKTTQKAIDKLIKEK